MRSKLKIPPEFSRIGVQRQHAVGIEVVPRARAAIEIRRGIAGAPINCIEFRIVRAGHPRGAAAALVQFAGPARGAKLAWPGNRPELPRKFPRLGIIGGHEPAHPVVAAGSSHQHFVLHDQRRARRPVILVSLGVRNVPQQMPGARIQAEQMGVVRFHIEARA